MPKPIKEHLAAVDPLSPDALEDLLNFREEDNYVDYKEEFHFTEEREWLEITKDVVAFSNTEGGYLVFGVRNGSFEPIGVNHDTADALDDANNVLQKLNRFVEPNITSVRCKRFEIEGKTFIAFYMPASSGKTHMISKDGSFKFRSGESKVILRQGTTYVRRSGSNHLVDSNDLDEIVERRIQFFRSSLLDKIAKVVEAPSASEIMVVSKVPTDEPHTKFIIEDSTDSIPVKGMSFTVAPSSTEEEIAGWIAMETRDARSVPGPGLTWKWYGERNKLKLLELQKVSVAKYCLLVGTPAFYWLKDCKAAGIKSMLVDAIGRTSEATALERMVSLGAFLGKRFHKSLLGHLGEAVNRLSPNCRKFPETNPRTLFRADRLVSRSHKIAGRGALEQELIQELDEIAASSVKRPDQQPPLTQRWRADSLDCFLYARDNQYS